MAILRQEASTKLFGTGVLLLLAVAKIMLRVIGPLPKPRDRRKPSKRARGARVYRYNTGSESELLDIGALRVTMPPGLFSTSEAHHVTQTRGTIPGHARFGWGNELEDGSRHPQ